MGFREFIEFNELRELIELSEFRNQGWKQSKLGTRSVELGTLP
jgi:hypothetical protein